MTPHWHGAIGGYKLATTGRKKVLIVNCCFDSESRRAVRRSHIVTKPMAPVYLAGAFSRELCDVRVYCEVTSGPLIDPKVLAWPDVLVLTGLTTALDRMKHLTAYARTLNENVIVVAGGPAIRALPRYCGKFFDHCCTGDIEQIREVIEDSLGRQYLAEEMFPRYDLAYWLGRIGQVESSRNCNFRCKFCSLTGEGGAYQRYDLGYIRRQILAQGKRDFVLFIDNNFYGNDRSFFLDRLEILKDLRRSGSLRSWTALVTNDFFLNQQNVDLARESGCIALFSGVESFDDKWLRGMNKMQNTRLPQLDLIRNCLNSGIVFMYGLMLDVVARSVADLRLELEFVTGTSEITLPAYLTVPIPYPGTPFFDECVSRNLFLPRTKIRDLDGTTLVLRPRDSLSDVVPFLREIRSMKSYRGRIIRSVLGFTRNYRGVLTRQQMLIASASPALLMLYSVITAPRELLRVSTISPKRTYLSSTEPLDNTYTPAMPLASKYAQYFRPTMLTDGDGALTKDIAADFSGCRQPPARQQNLVPTSAL